MAAIALGVVVGGGACGGASRAVESGPSLESAEAASPATQDQSFDLESETLQGARRRPGAAGLPALPQIRRAKRPGLEAARQRALRPGASIEDIQMFAIVGFAEAATRRALGDVAGAEALQAEARAPLARLGAMPTVSPLTRELLATTALWSGDADEAAGHYRALLEAEPAHSGAPSFRAWLAFALLEVGDEEAAAEALAPVPLDRADPFALYISAWVAHRRGDAAGARQTMARALKMWAAPAAASPTSTEAAPAAAPESTEGDVLERELLFMVARGGTPIGEALPLLEDVAAGDAKKLYSALFLLSEAYKYAGYYREAEDALGALLERDAPPADRVGFRFRQADYAFRDGRPTDAAAHAIAAQEALEACGAGCSAETAAAVAERISRLSQFFHTSFAASLDDRRFQAAEILYKAYLELPGRDDADAMRGYLSDLEDTRKNARPASGLHNSEILGSAVLARREALLSCYEAELGRTPLVGGAVTLRLEIDSTGTVAGAASEPAAGAEGLPRVGDCLARRARSWTFPSRTVPGSTRLSIPLALERRP